MPAKVLNLSLGGSGACGSTTQSAINGARSRGAVVVGAGNSNADVAGFNPDSSDGGDRGNPPTGNNDPDWFSVRLGSGKAVSVTLTPCANSDTTCTSATPTATCWPAASVTRAWSTRRSRRPLRIQPAGTTELKRAMRRPPTSSSPKNMACGRTHRPDAPYSGR